MARHKHVHETQKVRFAVLRVENAMPIVYIVEATVAAKRFNEFRKFFDHELLTLVRAALTEWVQKFPSGERAFADAHRRPTLYDFIETHAFKEGLLLGAEMRECLKANGVESLTVTDVNVASSWTHDSPIVDVHAITAQEELVEKTVLKVLSDSRKQAIAKIEADLAVEKEVLKGVTDDYGRAILNAKIVAYEDALETIRKA